MLVWDFMCPDTVAPSHINNSSTAAGSAAATAELNKRTKYSALDHGYEVTAVAVETMGTWGPEAMAISSALGARLQQVSGDKRSTAFLRQRLSLAVQRGNAAAIRGTLAQSDPIDS